MQTSPSLKRYKNHKYLLVLGIVRYAWDNKYILQPEMQEGMGSSRFGHRAGKFGNFGSVALAWIASDEKWMKARTSILVQFFSNSGEVVALQDQIPAPTTDHLSRWARNSISDILLYLVQL